jgi:putative nucleotidyltransferase with HDIG domain
MELNKNLISKIHKNVSRVTSTLEDAGFEAYLVGGCVRDLLIGRVPKDWDVTTNAKPEDIIKLFENTVYENTFGTVGVCLPTQTDVTHETEKDDVSCVTTKSDVIRETHRNSVSHVTELNDGAIFNRNLEVSRETPEYDIIEVTPYRVEAKYSDFRHPDEVKFSDNLEDDLKRRDFTVNAMAVRNEKGNFLLTDKFDGIKDIKDKVLRTVGSPDDRFTEDALRMLRAIRFSVQLDFTIAHETAESIFKNSHLIKNISQERIRDELVKIIMSENPSAGILMLQKFGLLKYVVPELEEGIGCEQSGEHIYDVWNHLLHALQHAAEKNWPLEVRLSALFHDIGKPKSRRNSTVVGKKKYTFYGHEVIGARVTKKILERLKFSNKEIELIDKLVRNHMFFSDTELITLSAVRRIIAKVGKENIWLLMNVRECDRVGMKKKEAPYRLRKYFAMIEEALHDPISVGQLKIDGEFLIKSLGMKPGPRMGWILNALLEEVIDDPLKNTEEHLGELVRSLDLLPDGALKALGDRGKEKKEELEEEEINKLHKKHGV